MYDGASGEFGSVWKRQVEEARERKRERVSFGVSCDWRNKFEDYLLHVFESSAH